MCGLLCPGILQARILQWVVFPPGDLLNTGMEPRSPALQADSLPSEALEKLKTSKNLTLLKDLPT